MPPTDSHTECIRCRNPLPSAATRCLHCGALPGRQCPVCKGLSPAASVVCVFCGSRMPLEAPIFLAGLDPLPGQIPMAAASHPAKDTRLNATTASQSTVPEFHGTPQRTPASSMVRTAALMLIALALGIVLGRSLWANAPRPNAHPSPTIESVTSLPPPTPAEASQDPPVESKVVETAAAHADSTQPLSIRGDTLSQGAQVTVLATSVPPLPNNPVEPQPLKKPEMLKMPVNYATDKASVQTIVQALCAQAGLSYDWGKSYANTNPTCRAFVWNVSFVGDSCDRALDSILSPKGLTYTIENDRLVLIKK